MENLEDEFINVITNFHFLLKWALWTFSVLEILYNNVEISLTHEATNHKIVIAGKSPNDRNLITS